MTLQEYRAHGEPAADQTTDVGATNKSERASGSSRNIWLVVPPRLRRAMNSFTLGHAGYRRLFKYAVVHHQGRRSGRSYATPTSARPLPDGFVVPMTFGERADWVRNVLAAGGCVIEWKGVEYKLVDPEIVDLAAIRSAFSPVERALLPVIGVKQYLRLRYAPTSSAHHA